MNDLIGQTLGHYRIVEKIGAGGMGVVYRAHDERLDRDVAIKVLHESVAQDADRLARFEREARAVAKLDHPNILSIHHFGTDQGVTYVVTELLEGESLREVIANGELTTRKAVEYAGVIADGLAAAHEKGITHRDLKPENLFLTRDGRIKILDFGLAKLREPEDDLATETPTASLETAPQRLIGTVAYMAPEQVEGRPADHRSDIFALGVVLYEMLTNRRPFSGSTSVATAAAILKDDPEPISRISPAVPPTLAGVVSKCLEKRPQDRFSSAHDLSLTLNTIDVETPIPPIDQESMIRRRWPHILAVVIAAVIALIVVLPPEGMFDRLMGEADFSPIRTIAILPLENLTGDPGQQFLVDGLHEELIATFAQISGFEKVIARTSVMGFRDSDVSIREIGEKLGVEAVLEGSVRRSGNTVRATLQLIEARNEDHLWAESYDRELIDILALQSEIARTVAGEVKVKLSPEEEARLVEARPVKKEAYEAYLRGEQIRQTAFSEDANFRAIRYFERAIEHDPSFAPPQIGTSVALRHLTHYRPPTEVMPQAHVAALRALELDDNSAGAHTALGRVKAEWEWDWSGAEAEYRRALDLSPNDGWTLRSYAALLVVSGRFEEGIAMEERAVELNPLEVRALTSLGWSYFFARRFDDGIEHLLNTIEIYPNDYVAHLYLSFNFWGKGLYTEAVAEIERAGTLHSAPDDDPFHLAIMTYCYWSAGRTAEAAESLQRMLRLDEERYISPAAMAIAYSGTDDKDQAIGWWEKAYEVRDPQLVVIKVNPALDSLRSDPRFQDIVHRMNFPEN